MIDEHAALSRIAVMLGVEDSPTCYLQAEKSVETLVQQWNALNDICDTLHAEPPSGWLVISTLAHKLYNFFPTFSEAENFAAEFDGDILPQYSTPLTRTKP